MKSKKPKNKQVFKKLKYNVVCLLMVALVLSAVFIKLYFFDTNIPDSDTGQEIVDPENPDNNNPSGPGDNDDPFDIIVDDVSDPKVKELKKLPISLVNYCIAKLANSDGYRSTINYTVTLNVPFIDASATQWVKGEARKEGDKLYEEVAFTGDALMQKFSPNDNIEIRYFDSANTHIWRTPLHSFDINEAAYTYHEGRVTEGWDRFYYNKLNVATEFNSKGSNGTISQQKNSQTGKNEYIVKMTLVNKDFCPEPFMRPYYTFLWQLDIKTFEQTVTFVIDKDTGWIKSITQKDKFIGNYADYPGIDVYVDLTHTQRFSQFNQPVPITTPTIPEREDKKE